jgi:hypothetical protein
MIGTLGYVIFIEGGTGEALALELLLTGELRMLVLGIRTWLGQHRQGMPSINLTLGGQQVSLGGAHIHVEATCVSWT